MRTPRRIAIVGLIGLSLAWAAWAAGTPPAKGREARDAIARKSQAERDQLERRYEEFNKLFEAQRAEILRIHESVESNPELAKTLENYTEFVSALDPWEREQLESQDDPAKRIAQVDEMLDAKHGSRGDMRHPGWITGETVRGTTFRSDDFQEMLERLTAMSDIPTATTQKRGSVEWQLWIMKRLAAKWESDDFKSWPNAAATNELLEKLPDERFREYLRQSDRFDDERRRKVLAAVLSRTLMARWQREVADRIPKEELRAAVSSLKEREERDWIWRDPARMQTAIIETLTKKPGPVGNYAKGYLEARELYHEFDPFADGRRHGGREDRDDDDHDRNQHDRDDDRRNQDGQKDSDQEDDHSAMGNDQDASRASNRTDD